MDFEKLDKGYRWGGIPKETEIEINKKMRNMMSNVRKGIKPTTCFCCGKEITSCCNSHSIPRFCLENIGTLGMVAGINSILELPEMGVTAGKRELGVNESGTFNLICRECDNEIFQEYENPDNYKKGIEPSSKMVAQIALKNYLKVIHKRKTEIEIFKNSLAMINNNFEYGYLLDIELREKMRVSKLDLQNYEEEYDCVKKYLEKGKGDGFYLFYYRLLDYVAPIAIQSPVAVIVDFDGTSVNDIYNKNPQYLMSDLHICVFPLKEHTAVLLFVKNSDKRYRRFRKQFNKLDENSKLGVINYIIFLYCEDYYMANSIKYKMDIGVFKEIANLTSNIWDTKPIDTSNLDLNAFNLSKWNSIPNLLSEEHKLR